MTVKYVVSIADDLLYFDADRQPAPPFPDQAENEDRKPALKLVPPEQRPAAGPEWDSALHAYPAAQRESAEISEVI